MSGENSSSSNKMLKSSTFTTFGRDLNSRNRELMEDDEKIKTKSKIKEIAYMLSKIFLDASLIATGVLLFCFSTGPVFIIGGGIFALASILYTVADVLKFVKNIKAQSEIDRGSLETIEIRRDSREGDSPMQNQGKEIHEWLNFAAPLLLSLGLLCFGILAFATPALLGMTGLSLVFKICSLVAGAAFGMKALMNFLGCEGSKSSSFKMLLKNASNVLIYGTGLALGISVLVLNGAFTAIPFVFTLIFGLRTVASVLDIFGKNGSTKGVGRVARFLKSISFAVSAVSLGAAAIFFAPVVASWMGVTASFVQIAGGIGCGVCLFAAVMKFMFGFGSNSRLKFSPCYMIFVKSDSDKHPSDRKNLEERRINQEEKEYKEEDGGDIKKKEGGFPKGNLGDNSIVPPQMNDNNNTAIPPKEVFVNKDCSTFKKESTGNPMTSTMPMK